MFTLHQRVKIQDTLVPAKQGKVGTIERIVDSGSDENSQIWVKLDTPIEGESRPNFRDFYRTRNPEADLVAIACGSECVNHDAESDLGEAANAPDPVAKACPDRFGFNVGDTVVCTNPGQSWSHNGRLAARLGQTYSNNGAGWAEPTKGELYTVLSSLVGDDKDGVILEENAYAIKHTVTGKVSIVCNRAIEAVPVEKAAEPTPEVEAPVEAVSVPEAGILQFHRNVKHCDLVMFGDQKCIAIDINGDAVATMMFDDRAVRLFAIK